MVSGVVWHILTGEYPPHCGGVGDHSALIGRGLAKRGCAVHVWQPNASEQAAANLHVHAIGSFGLRGLQLLERSLNALPTPRILLVQYVPNAFGWRGANLPFCRWLLRRSRSGDDVRIFFHEPYFYFARQSLRRNLLAAVQRIMAWLLLRAARRVYVSNPAWEGLLRPYAPRRSLSMKWLPIPSTIPCIDNADAIADLRRSVSARWKVGHFGSFNDNIAPFLTDSLRELLRREPDVVVKLLGSGADRHARMIAQDCPELSARVLVIGRVSAEEISAHLQTLDLAIQPYPDGVSSRRTSAMACLANGVPTLSTVGEWTEPTWFGDQGIKMTPAGDAAAFVFAAQGLVHDEAARRTLAEAGRKLYRRCFALEHTLDNLLAEAPA